MKVESNLVLEIWDLIRDQIPAARRLDTAISVLRAFEEYGFDEKDLQDIVDEEPYLTRAYYDLFAIEQSEEEDENYNDDE